MSGLLFPFKGLIDECEAIKAYAIDFLDKTTIGVLAEAKGTLESIQAGKHMGVAKWQIPADRPLCTVWSDGESQRDGNSKHKIRAEFSFVWEIRKFAEGKWKAGNKVFLLEGLASTVTTLVAELNAEKCVMARWTTEVGDAASPGTHCHSQVNRPRL